MNASLQIQPHEYTEVIQRLRRRYLTNAAKQRWGIEDVYLGQAYRQDTADQQRELAVVFQVVKKYQRLPSVVERLPPQVTIYLWRNGKRRRVQIPTDVEQVAEIIPSGRWIYLTNDSTAARQRLTCGCVVRWQVQTRVGLQTYWAVVTVGHAWGELPMGATELAVTIESRFGPPIVGRLIASTGRRGIDAAIVLIDPESLARDGIDLARRQRWLTLTELSDDYRRSGQSLDVVHDGVLIEAETPPQPRLLGVLGMKQQIIQVRSENRNAFQPGSSGTVWLLRTNDNAHALAALQLATRREDYSVGYGQVFDGELLDWIRAMAVEFHLPELLVPRSFSIIRAF